MKANNVLFGLVVGILVLPQAATAADQLRRPMPTSTPIPTVTPYPTYTPLATATTYPTYTVAPTATPIPQGPRPNGTYCTGLFGWCPDLGGLLGAAVGALFDPLAHFFGDGFAAVTAPFTHALTYSPDLSTDEAFGGVRTFQTTLQQLAAVLFVGFLVIGLLATYLASIGAGSFGELTTPLRRAVLATGFIAGYQSFMAWGFKGLNGLDDWVNNAPIGARETGFSAIAHAFNTLTTALSPTGVIDALIIAIGMVVTLLCVVIRTMGLGMLAALYAVGPLALVTWLSPQFAFIAKWWFRTFLSVALWPLGYAVALKITANLLDAGGAIESFGGLVSSLGALGMLMMLYRVPAIVGSMVGAAGAVLGAGASAVTNAGIGAGLSMLTQRVGAVVIGHRGA